MPGVYLLRGSAGYWGLGWLGGVELCSLRGLWGCYCLFRTWSAGRGSGAGRLLVSSSEPACPVCPHFGLGYQSVGLVSGWCRRRWHQGACSSWCGCVLCVAVRFLLTGCVPLVCLFIRLFILWLSKLTLLGIGGGLGLGGCRGRGMSSQSIPIIVLFYSVVDMGIIGGGYVCLSSATGGEWR